MKSEQIQLIRSEFVKIFDCQAIKKIDAFRGKVRTDINQKRQFFTPSETQSV